MIDNIMKRKSDYRKNRVLKIAGIILTAITYATTLAAHELEPVIQQHPQSKSEALDRTVLVINGKTIVKKSLKILHAKASVEDDGVYLVAEKNIIDENDWDKPKNAYTAIYGLDGALIKNKFKDYDCVIDRVTIDKDATGWEKTIFYIIAKKYIFKFYEKKYYKFSYGLANENGEVVVPPQHRKFYVELYDGCGLGYNVNFLPDHLIHVNWPDNVYPKQNSASERYRAKGCVEDFVYNIHGDRMGYQYHPIFGAWNLGDKIFFYYDNGYYPSAPLLKDNVPAPDMFYNNVIVEDGKTVALSGDYKYVLDENTLLPLGEGWKFREHFSGNYYTFKENGHIGIQTEYGKTIIPAVCKDIRFEGKSACTGDNKRTSGWAGSVLVATHASKGGLKTGYGYFSPYKAVYNLHGQVVIPFSRGYDEITPMIEKYSVRHNIQDKDKPKLWYSFTIETDGLSIIGLCDVHGRELWRGVNLTDDEGMIDYDRHQGFYYENTSGGKTWIETEKLGDKDFEWTADCVEENPNWSIEYTVAHTPHKWSVSDDGLGRCQHNEENFKWIEVKDGQHEYAEDQFGNIIVGKRENTSFSFVRYRKNSYVRGFFFRSSYDGSGMHSEVFTLEGNPVITLDQAYQSIRLDADSKYFITQNDEYIGVCDLNGYEVASPKYVSVYYDGYEFEGEKPNGSIDRFMVHEKPPRSRTRRKSSSGSSNGWYYDMTPWLWMPASGYTPTFTMDWNTPVFTDSYQDVSGGVSDFQPSDNTDLHVSGNKKCPYCNGTGKRIYDDYSASTFGLDQDLKTCNVCGFRYPSNKTHSHIKCGYCSGTGKMR